MRGAGVYAAHVRTRLTQSVETADLNILESHIFEGILYIYIYIYICVENISNLLTLKDTIKHTISGHTKAHKEDFISSFYFANSHIQNTQSLQKYP